MVDFTAYAYPVMAVACPRCRAKVGTMCKRPSEHNVWGGWHDSRAQLADDTFVAQHGARAGLLRREDGSFYIVPDHLAPDDPRVVKYTKPTASLNQPSRF